LETVLYTDLGLIPYREGWDVQEKYFNDMVQAKLSLRTHPDAALPPHRLFLCEHPHVYTLGKSGSMDNLLLNEDELLAHDIEFYKNNRGGDITYHGPGAIVGYPILDLERFFTDIHKYMRCLEEIIIRTLADYGIAAGRIKEYTGVWLDPENPAKARKICAYGVKCSRWVTMHGWSFNVNTDLSYFNNIIPCGIKDKDVTSLARELGHKVDMAEVKTILLGKFEEVFGCRLV